MSLESEFKRWEKESVKPILNKSPERKLEFESPSGIPIPRVVQYQENEDYLSKNWVFRENIHLHVVFNQPCIVGDSGRCANMLVLQLPKNQITRYRYLFAQGQTGLSVAFDLPTQIGYDADDPMCSWRSR